MSKIAQRLSIDRLTEINPVTASLDGFEIPAVELNSAENTTHYQVKFIF